MSSVGAWAQNSSSSSAPLPDAPQPTNDKPSPSPPPSQAPSQNAPTQAPKPNFTPPSSDHVDASALPEGSSSSKDDDVDLSPPAGDAAAHPNSPSSFGVAPAAAPGAFPEANINEMRPFNPHKAAKDIEVGDFYFKRKNYHAAESRYREALLYKDNDAIATYRLAVCLDKLQQPDEAREEYESYLKILPHGPEAEHAQKAIERLKSAAVKSNPAK